MGLPLFAVPVLVTVFDLPTAVALMMIPILASNLIQAWEGKNKQISISSFKRFFPLIITLIPFTVFTAQFISKIDIKLGSLFMGIIVIVFSLSNLIDKNFTIQPKIELIASPFIGIVAGILGGISSLIGPLIAMYLIALKLEKDFFVITIAIIFLCFSITFYITLTIYGVMNFNNITGSILATIPVMFGVIIGNKIRSKVNQKKFKVFLIFFLIIIGINLIRKGLF
ncbi:MAG: hypothetical protein CMM49_06220 [Rhodospirillaceae bacterium]|nr:hypothetical protein [Rhodospirillaceae bacterium]